jgi:hypothetical protein
MAGGIFISYRRAGAKDAAARFVLQAMTGYF